MPGTGPIGANEKWEIKIELQGGLSKSEADHFDDDLREFIRSHKAANYKVTWTKSDKPTNPTA
jgi:hypothetical protein